MSRIGKKPIEIPRGVQVQVVGQEVNAVGPKGTLKLVMRPEVTLKAKDGKVVLMPKGQLSKSQRGLWGLYRALVANMVRGVSQGFEKKLEIEGVGFKAAVQGEELVLNVGFVNPVKVKKPEGITFAVDKNVITVSGVDKEKVGQVAAEIRAAKKAEPYKGKGIKYQGERIQRKEGKKVVAAKK